MPRAPREGAPRPSGARLVVSCGPRPPPLLLGALEGDHAGADQLDDPERAHLVDEGAELALVAGDLEREGLPGDVDDAGPEVLRDLPDLDPVVRRPDGDLDEHQLAADVRRVRVVDDGEDVDELLELLRDLLDGRVLAGHDERRAREAGALGWRNQIGRASCRGRVMFSWMALVFGYIVRPNRIVRDV